MICKRQLPLLIAVRSQGRAAFKGGWDKLTRMFVSQNASLHQIKQSRSCREFVTEMV